MAAKVHRAPYRQVQPHHPVRQLRLHPLLRHRRHRLQRRLQVLARVQRPRVRRAPMTRMHIDKEPAVRIIRIMISCINILQKLPYEKLCGHHQSLAAASATFSAVVPMILNARCTGPDGTLSIARRTSALEKACPLFCSDILRKS